MLNILLLFKVVESTDLGNLKKENIVINLYINEFSNSLNVRSIMEM